MKKELIKLANKIINNPEQKWKVSQKQIVAAFTIIHEIALHAAFGDETANKLLQKMDKLSWLSVLTDNQRALRKQKLYDEINLTDEQKELLGAEGCCWIESPSFYENSQWSN